MKFTFLEYYFGIDISLMTLPCPKRVAKVSGAVEDMQEGKEKITMKPAIACRSAEQAV